MWFASVEGFSRPGMVPLPGAGILSKAGDHHAIPRRRVLQQSDSLRISLDFFAIIIFANTPILSVIATIYSCIVKIVIKSLVTSTH